MRNLVTAFKLLILLFPLVGQANDSLLPPAYKVLYSLYKSGLPVAQTEYQLDISSSSVKFSSHTWLTGFATLFDDSEIFETSRFDILNDHLRLNYYERRRTGNKSEHITSKLNTKQNKFLVSVNDKQIAIKYTDGILDEASIFLAIMQHAKAEATTEDKTQRQYHVLDDEKVAQYTLSFKQLKEIELFDDEWIETQVWVLRKFNSSRNMLVYLSAEKHFLPVMIEQFKNDELYAVLRLQQVEWQ